MQKFKTTVYALLLCGASLAPAMAQPMGRGEGYMMGPGMMAGRGGDLCSPRAAGIAEWRIDRIERAVKLTDAQKPKLEELRLASRKAADDMRKACPSSWPATASERLAAMETRLETMLAAMKTVRPAFDAFYATLDADQKQRLDSAGPRSWGWRWWHRN